MHGGCHPEGMYEYSARLVRIVDADTIVLDVDLGMSVWVRGQLIRVLGVDAPEMSTEAGRAAKAWAVAWFAQHCPAGELVVRTRKADNFGRYLGVIVAPDGAVLADDLLAAGHATVYGLPRQAS